MLMFMVLFVIFSYSLDTDTVLSANWKDDSTLLTWPKNWKAWESCHLTLQRIHPNWRLPFCFQLSHRPEFSITSPWNTKVKRSSSLYSMLKLLTLRASELLTSHAGKISKKWSKKTNKPNWKWDWIFKS